MITLVQYSLKHRTEEGLGKVTNPIFAAGEKLAVLLPGIGPFNLFLSNLSSTRFCSFPSSDGILPVNPLEWKFLHDMNKAKAFSFRYQRWCQTTTDSYMQKRYKCYLHYAHTAQAT